LELSQTIAQQSHCKSSSPTHRRPTEAQSNSRAHFCLLSRGVQWVSPISHNCRFESPSVVSSAITVRRCLNKQLCHITSQRSITAATSNPNGQVPQNIDRYTSRLKILPRRHLSGWAQVSCALRRSIVIKPRRNKAKKQWNKVSPKARQGDEEDNSSASFRWLAQRLPIGPCRMMGTPHGEPHV
jgi:hypothetical protein